MADISHMDWAQQIKMDHDLNIRKDTLKVKKDPQKNLQDITCLFHSSTESRICSNLFKIAIFKDMLALGVLRMTKYTGCPKVECAF